MTLLIILTSDLQDRFIKALNKYGQIHYTFFTQVYGKGDGGMRYDKDYAPGENTMFLIDTEDNDTIGIITQIVDDIKKDKKPKQGLHIIHLKGPHR